jgi:hypothetical protein
MIAFFFAASNTGLLAFTYGTAFIVFAPTLRTTNHNSKRRKNAVQLPVSRKRKLKGEGVGMPNAFNRSRLRNQQEEREREQ